MKVEVSKQEDHYIMDIVVPKGIVEKEKNSLAKDMRPRVQLKGYRKGNVPIEVVKSTYRDTILAEVSTRLLYSAVSDALKEHNIKNASNPTLLEDFRPNDKKKYVGKLSLDGSISFKVSVETPPEIDVKDYKGVDVKIDANSFDKWVKKEIGKKQNMFGEKEVVNRPAKHGDEINIAFKGFVDGEEFTSESDFTFQIGEGAFVDGFEDAFIGRSPGEEFSVDVVFPDDYGNQKLNGKKANFNVSLYEVVETKPHPLNDELAQMLSYESVDSMMEAYKDIWEKEFQNPLKSQIFNSIMDSVIESNPFKVPQSWVEQEMKITAKRTGLGELPKDADMLGSISEVSERAVRISYILDKIYEKEEGLHLKAEDILSFAEKEGAAHKLSGEQVVEKLRQQNQYDAFVSYHEQQRTIDFIIESANIIEE